MSDKGEQLVNKSYEDYENKQEKSLGTPLNPSYGIETGVDITSFYDSKLGFAGASIDEHRLLEQANEYLGEEELEQQRDNL